jgi:hypothetical protein
MSLQEDYPSNFSMDEFNSIRSYRGKVKYAAERLKRLGSGSSRIVYQIDNEKVLKLAKNEKGLAQNEVETDNYLGQEDITANVFDYDDKHDRPYWIEMELAVPLNRNRKRLQQLWGFTFEEFEAFLATNDPSGRAMRHRHYELPQEKQDEMWENEYANGAITIAGNFGMPLPGDFIAPSSWGAVKRGGKVHPVLIDFGFTNDVHANYYAR